MRSHRGELSHKDLRDSSRPSTETMTLRPTCSQRPCRRQPVADRLIRQSRKSVECEVISQPSARKYPPFCHMVKLRFREPQLLNDVQLNHWCLRLINRGNSAAHTYLSVLRRAFCLEPAP